MNNELQRIADHLGGEVCNDDTSIYIRIDTGDNTSKENYDDLLGLGDNINHMLSEYKIADLWADHDTQIISFKKVIDTE